MTAIIKTNIDQC